MLRHDPSKLEKEIIDVVWKDLEPKTYSELVKSLSGYSFSKVANMIEKLSKDPLPKIKVKKYPFAYMVFPNLGLPELKIREGLDYFILEGQYPIVHFVSKMRQTGLPGTCIEIKGKGQLDKTLHSLMKESEENICWWAGDFSSFKRDESFFENALNNGVEIRLLMNISFHSVKNAEAVLSLRDSLPPKKRNQLLIRHWESGWRGSIFDGKKVLLIVKKHRTEPYDQSKGTPDTDATHFYEGWAIKDRKWVNYIKGWWGYFWKKAENGPKPQNLVTTIKEIMM